MREPMHLPLLSDQGYTHMHMHMNMNMNEG
jgi:hypothetical protein